MSFPGANPPPAEPWHLDKRVPVALIFTLLFQMAVALWWASGLDSRMQTAEMTNTRQDLQIDAVQAAANTQAMSSATLSAQMDGLRSSVIDLKTAQSETNRLLREMMQSAARMEARP